jgi:hypothetical protein
LRWLLEHDREDKVVFTRAMMDASRFQCRFLTATVLAIDDAWLDPKAAVALLLNDYNIAKDYTVQSDKIRLGKELRSRR